MNPSEKPKYLADSSTSSPKRALSKRQHKPILKRSRHLRSKYAKSVPPMRRWNRRFLPPTCDTTVSIVLETPVCYTLPSYSSTELYWVLSAPPPQTYSNQNVFLMPRVSAMEYMRFEPPRRLNTGSLVHMMTPPLIYTFPYADITSVTWVTTNPPPLLTVNSFSSEPMFVCPLHGTIMADAPTAIWGMTAPCMDTPPATEHQLPKCLSAPTSDF